jgi:hypothetical protein
MIRLLSLSRKRTVDGIGSLKCHCMTTHSPMVLGAGCPHPGWLTCAAKVKFTTKASSTTGFSAVTSGAQSLAGSALEVGCDAGDGSA